MSIDFGLKDVHVLITGAAGGIGPEAVKTFTQLGARVTAHYNSKIGELATLKDVVSVQADVRDEASVDRLLQQGAQQNGGPVSLLVVTHGIWPSINAHIADMELSQWQNTLAVDLAGPFLLCKSYLCALREASESVKDNAGIIFIGSAAGKFREPAATTPLQVATPADIAKQIAAIASRVLSGHVNGMNIMVDGGMEGRLLFPPTSQ